MEEYFECGKFTCLLQNYIKKIHNYEEIKILVSTSSQSFVNEIITLDVQRTFFDNDTDNKRKVFIL